MFLSKSLWCKSAAENYTEDKYSKQDKTKELKHFIKTHGSPKFLKEFLNKPRFCAIIEETTKMLLKSELAIKNNSKNFKRVTSS